MGGCNLKEQKQGKRGEEVGGRGLMVAIKGRSQDCRCRHVVLQDQPHHPRPTYLWFRRGQRFRWGFVARLPWRWRLRGWWWFHCWFHLVLVTVKRCC